MADEEQPRRRKRNMLKLFYGGNAAEPAPTGDPMDIDCSAFDSARYLDQLYTKLPLPQLVSKEKALGQQIRQLDGDMQTLVYENYNKFISATDTIRKMKSQVDDMDDEMEKLSNNMNNISNLSEGISDALGVKRGRIRKLTESHLLLKKLQFLFELPSRLKKCVERKAYEQAVRYYSRAANVLEMYKTLDSFKGINDECNAIMSEVTASVNELITADGASQDQIMSNIELLLVLKEDTTELLSRIFTFARAQFEADCAAQHEAYEAAKAGRPYEDLDEDDVDDSTGGGSGETTTAAALVRSVTGTSDGRPAGDDGGDDDGTAQSTPTKNVFDETPDDFASNTENTDEACKADTPVEGADADAEASQQFGASGENDQSGPAPSAALHDKHPLVVFLRHGNRRALRHLQDWINAAYDVFIMPAHRAASHRNPDDDDELEDRRGGRRAPADGTATPPTTPPTDGPTGKPSATSRLNEIAHTSTQELVKFVESIVGDEYVDSRVMRAFADDMTETQGGAPTPRIVRGLEVLSQGLRGLYKVFPEARTLRDIDVEASVSVSRRLCRVRGEALQANFLGRVADTIAALGTTPLTTTQPSPVPTSPGSAPSLPNPASTANAHVLLETLCRGVEDECMACVRTLVPLVSSEFRERSRFFEQELQDRSIRKGIIQAYITLILSHCRKFAETTVDGDSGRVTIVLAALCTRLSESTVQRLMVFALGLFPGTSGVSRDSKGNLTGMDDASEMQIAQKVHDAQDTATALLGRYVELAGRSLTDTMCRGLAAMDFATGLAEPTHVSPYVVDVAKGLVDVRMLSKDVFEPGRDEHDKRGTYNDYLQAANRGSSAVSSPTRSLTSNIQKLFSDRIEVFSSVDFHAAPVLFGVAKIVLKAMSETARMYTFETFGMQQMEVDVHYLGSALWPYIEDDDNEGVMCTLLGQIIQSVTSRCTHPESIGHGVVHMILEKQHEGDSDALQGGTSTA